MFVYVMCACVCVCEPVTSFIEFVSCQCEENISKAPHLPSQEQRTTESILATSPAPSQGGSPTLRVVSRPLPEPRSLPVS